MEQLLDLKNYIADFIKMQLDNEKIECELNNNEIEGLVKLAKSHQIVGIVYQSIIDLKIFDEKNETVLKNVCLKKIIDSTFQQHELKLVQEVFEKEKIKNMPMKGSLMKKYYNRPELREMSDLDICVEEQELEHVKDVLESMGYILKKRVSNHDIYYKEPSVVIEVHKCLYKQEIDKRQHEYFESFSNAILDEGKEYCYHQKLEDFYVYMIAHMAGHFYKKGCGVRNIIDLYVFDKKFKDVVDRRYIEQELEECGLTTFEKHMRSLKNIWLEGEQETSFYNDLLAYMLDCGIYGKDVYGVWQGYAKVDESAATSKEKMRRWYFFPTYTYMKQYYKYLENAPILLPFAWFHRAVKSFFRNDKEKSKQRVEYVNSVKKDEMEKIVNIYKQMDFKFE